MTPIEFRLTSINAFYDINCSILGQSIEILGTKMVLVNKIYVQLFCFLIHISKMQDI